MDRTVPFEEKEICDNCGKVGAYDFMGDYLCPKCTEETISIEPCNRCGCDPCECGIF